MRIPRSCGGRPDHGSLRSIDLLPTSTSARRVNAPMQSPILRGDFADGGELKEPGLTPGTGVPIDGIAVRRRGEPLRTSKAGRRQA
jgi:hypothetical protein